MQGPEYRALLHAAVGALRASNFALAIKAASRALAIADSSAARQVRGIARLRAGDDAGQRDLLVAVELDPRCVRAHRWLIKFARAKGSLRSALDQLVSAVRSTRDEELALVAADVCDQLHCPSEAVEILTLVADAGSIASRALAHRLAWAEDYGSVAGLVAGDESFEALHLACRAAKATGQRPSGHQLHLLAARATSTTERRLVVEDLLASGELDAALRYAQAHHDLSSEAALVALWSGACEAAARSADPVVRAAHAAVTKDWAEVLREADRALATQSDDADGWLWRGEALRHLGDSAQCLDALDRGRRRRPGESFAVHLNAALAKDHLEGVWWLPWLESFHGSSPHSTGQAMQAMQELLDSMHGNRSAHLTILDGAGWRLFEGPLDVRHESRILQMRVRTRPPAALAGLLELAERVPHDSQPDTHRGEVLLWLGRFADAEAAFRKALHTQYTTRWAWIGLGAAQLYLGDVEGALATWDTSQDVVIPGRTIWIYRAEAHMLRGDRTQAIECLQRSRELHPERLAVHVLGGLLDVAPDLAWARIGCACPALLDTCRADGFDVPSDEAFRHLLRIMRGNRALGMVTWFDDQRFCVYCPDASQGDPGRERL